jgi:NAD(P)-dependent dehydrogenase (short-subunit alcohol dehydrogenase family)
MPTALITGAANGIGAQTATHFFSLGYNVVIADLPFTRPAAEALIASLPTPSLSSTTPRTLFIPTNILIWTDMTSLYRKIIEEFGQIDVVIANAGMMESRDFWDLDADLDESGELKESLEAWRVIDVNLKGTMNSMFAVPFTLQSMRVWAWRG